MTAEIAILNKNAVALAADSAVTLRNPQTQKIYNTANKLFMLSKYHPVGVMVYGPADFMGVPWETVIKLYREELGTTNFNHLAEFADHFVEFIQNNELLFPPSAQIQELQSLCQWVIGQMRERIDNKVKEELQKGSLDDKQVEAIVAAVIAEEVKEWNRYRRLECFPEGFEGELVEEYRAALEEVIKSALGELPLGDTGLDNLLVICAHRITKEWWSLKTGGMVVAGFGRNDILPVLHSYNAECVANGRLKYDRIPSQSNDMNESHAASIIPFAQAEIVFRFIRGIDPDYRKEVTNFIRTLLLSEYPKKLIEQFQDRLTDDEKRNTTAELIRLGRKVLEEQDASWNEWEHRRFVGPVVDIVGDLPKDDLAAMAESLVNLTSFKRRITAETETVGGPIDVAVISKGDGFVWIKRKHYFEKDLNPAFFANYYRRGMSDE